MQKGTVSEKKKKRVGVNWVNEYEKYLKERNRTNQWLTGNVAGNVGIRVCSTLWAPAQSFPKKSGKSLRCSNQE